MRATRRRIDEKLDLLQARMSAQSGAVTRAAVGGGALLSAFYMWAKLRAKRQTKRRRQHAREHLLARARGMNG
jgi:hypothetical protein